eukprot:gb/GECG01002475.1/.p1 GENE.gb/GECG01002475.1/~~gb/GECG01002475.1/.p1  ORF type:complete len:126 (+),score=12.85 gb/GECG01002475.1/:1-378(+)
MRTNVVSMLLRPLKRPHLKIPPRNCFRLSPVDQQDTDSKRAGENGGKYAVIKALDALLIAAAVEHPSIVSDPFGPGDHFHWQYELQGPSEAFLANSSSVSEYMYRCKMSDLKAALVPRFPAVCGT